MRREAWVLGLFLGLSVVAGCSEESPGSGGPAGASVETFGADAAVEASPRKEGAKGTRRPADESRPRTPEARGDGTRDAGAATDGGGPISVDGGDAEAPRDAAGPEDGGADAEALADAGATSDDAGAAEGSPCGKVNAMEERPCGVCGKQLRLCGRTDRGALAWGAWGYCQGELANGCLPGTRIEEPCGGCGTKEVVCGTDCRPQRSFCIEPPGAECAPGETQFIVGLSCPQGQGRFRKCRERDAGPLACRYEPFSGCLTGRPPGGELVLGPSAGEGTVVAADFRLSNDRDRLSSPEFSFCRRNQVDKCPKDFTGPLTRYAYVRIANKTGRAATLSLWTSPSEVPSEREERMDMVLALYGRDTAPTGPDERKACLGVLNCGCSTSPCLSQQGFAGLTAEMETELRATGRPRSLRPKVPSGESVLVYVGMRKEDYAGKPGFRLHARLDGFD